MMAKFIASKKPAKPNKNARYKKKKNDETEKKDSDPEITAD